jgi:hypothetical protein
MVCDTAAGLVGRSCAMGRATFQCR